MVKPARSSQRKEDCYICLFLPYFAYTFSTRTTHILYNVRVTSHLSACSFKSPVFQDHNSTQGVTVGRTALWFLLGWVETQTTSFSSSACLSCLSFSFLSTVLLGLLREVEPLTPLLCVLQAAMAVAGDNSATSPSCP